MTFTPVEPTDAAAVAAYAALTNAANAVDDPHELPSPPEAVALELTYGWDLEPAHVSLYTPAGAASPVGALRTMGSERDNLHALSVGVVVHPDHRRQGHGSAMIAEGLRQAERAGRTTVWSGTHDEDPAGAAFAARFGFTRAAREARRTQDLTAVDRAAVDRLYEEAEGRATGYTLERRYGTATPDDLLSELVTVTASINDAPMGDLSWEPEVFDLPRLRHFETAQAGQRNRMYRIFARDNKTGEIGGHTIVGVSAFHRTRAWQYDTAVHRDHRGYRLGALLKIAMMRWIAAAEPEITEIDTWNNTDNSYMISINEQIGYRLSGGFRRLGADAILTLPPWPIDEPRHGRVRLRAYEAGDTASCKSSRETRTCPSSRHCRRTRTRRRPRTLITRQLTRHATGAGFPFVVVVAATGAPVGTIGLWCERLAAGRASAGYAIAPTARGNGDAADALEALIDFAWSIEGLETVDLFIEPDNAASLASARHAGFRATAGLVDHEVAGHRAAMRRFARTRGR